MQQAIRRAYRVELTKAKRCYRNGLWQLAFGHLERAHVLGQRYIRPHYVTHWWMLKCGWKQRSAKEVLGQILRLMAVLPGFLTGWVPFGNTGGANVSALKPMPLPADLQALFPRNPIWLDVKKRLYVGLGLAALLILGSEFYRSQLQSSIDTQWQHQEFRPLAGGGAVQKLMVTTLVNWHSADPAFSTEAGVSYLIEADGRKILFDLGLNRHQESPSPLQVNMDLLDVFPAELDMIFISHLHPDHVGGRDFANQQSFSFGMVQQPLPAGTRIITPTPMQYPGSQPEYLQQPQQLLPGIATTGPIPRQLPIGRIDEQALVIHLAGKGLVLFVGCGHQGLDKLLQLVEQSFTEPLYAIVGDLHLPVPHGRLTVAGIDVQRRLASGDGMFDPIDTADVRAAVSLLAAKFSHIWIGGHDSSDEALGLLQQAMPGRVTLLKVGDSHLLSD
jgi:metal-dependent hydrolase (beta-lactamase superfamily II)